MNFVALVSNILFNCRGVVGQNTSEFIFVETNFVLSYFFIFCATNFLKKLIWKTILLSTMGKVGSLLSPTVDKQNE